MAFGDVPDLAERQRRDSAPYAEMQRRGELWTPAKVCPSPPWPGTDLLRLPLQPSPSSITLFDPAKGQTPWRCVRCGGYGNEADHIRPLDAFPDQDPYDLDGLQTLCRACHVEKTRGENRREPTPAEAEWAAFVLELAGK